MSKRVRVRTVELLSGTRVRLGFTSGEIRDVDLARYLRGPIFESIRASSQEFRMVRVDAELGTIVWPNGADIDPDVLYENLVPAWSDAEEPASR